MQTLAPTPIGAADPAAVAPPTNIVDGFAPAAEESAAATPAAPAATTQAVVASTTAPVTPAAPGAVAVMAAPGGTVRLPRFARLHQVTGVVAHYLVTKTGVAVLLAVLTFVSVVSVAKVTALRGEISALRGEVAALEAEAFSYRKEATSHRQWAEREAARPWWAKLGRWW